MKKNKAKKQEKFDFKSASSYHKEWSTVIFDIIGNPLSVFFVKYTKITPNQVSLLSLVFGIIAGIFLYMGGYTNLIIGGACAFIYNVLDMIDGRVARARRVSTLFGKWLDAMIDFSIFPYLVFMLALGIGTKIAAIIGMLAIVSYQTHYLIVYFYKSQIVEKKDNIELPGKGRWEWLRYVYGSNFFYLFLFVAALANKPMAVLLFWAVFGNLYWVMVIITQGINIRRLERK